MNTSIFTKPTTFRLMLLGVFACAKYGKVFNAIIKFIAVLVMHFFALFKVAAKVLLHYKAVLSDITLVSMWVVLNLHHFIAKLRNKLTSTPHRIASTCVLAFSVLRNLRPSFDAVRFALKRVAISPSTNSWEQVMAVSKICKRGNSAVEVIRHLSKRITLVIVEALKVFNINFSVVGGFHTNHCITTLTYSKEER